MPCIQKARKVQSQVLVFCLDPSITFQLRPLPLLPFLNFPPPFLLSIYGFLYLPTSSRGTFPYSSRYPELPEFTFELSSPPHLSQSLIHFSSSTSSLNLVFFVSLFYRSSFFLFFFLLLLLLNFQRRN